MAQDAAAPKRRAIKVNQQTKKENEKKLTIRKTKRPR
jgi:hypothetical protein